jgi:hypothetical protein
MNDHALETIIQKLRENPELKIRPVGEDDEDFDDIDSWTLSDYLDVRWHIEDEFYADKTANINFGKFKSVMSDFLDDDDIRSAAIELGFKIEESDNSEDDDDDGEEEGYF